MNNNVLMMLGMFILISNITMLIIENDYFNAIGFTVLALLILRLMNKK